jgi:hypothetical protein
MIVGDIEAAGARVAIWMGTAVGRRRRNRLASPVDVRTSA